jgi:hypothetical protein
LRFPSFSSLDIQLPLPYFNLQISSLEGNSWQQRNSTSLA